MATIPLFNGFYDGLYQYVQSDSVSDEYLLRYRDIDVNKCQNYVENDWKCAKSLIFVV